MTISKQIWQEIEGIPKGEPFPSARFLAVGGRPVVDQTLYRLVKAGKIQRVSRGVFVRPTINPLIGEVRPGAEAVVGAIAQSTGEVIGEPPAKAERRFGLSTQMEMRPVFTTSGHTRTVRLTGGAEVKLRHMGKKRIQLAQSKSKSGMVLLALWSRGRENLTPAEVKHVLIQLNPKEQQELVSMLPKAPGWLSSIVHKNVRKVTDA